jgi:hypothetical protein
MSALWNAMFCCQVKHDSETLTMEAGNSSEYSDNFYQNIRCHNEEDSDKIWEMYPQPNGLELPLSQHKIGVFYFMGTKINLNYI